MRCRYVSKPDTQRRLWPRCSALLKRVECELRLQAIGITRPASFVSYVLLFPAPPASNIFGLFSSNSACTCPGQDHPGPSTSKGRGAPEIDLIEAQHNRIGSGQVASQSAQFAPMTHDYLYGNSTPDQWTIYNPNITRPNPYM